MFPVQSVLGLCNLFCFVLSCFFFLVFCSYWLENRGTDDDVFNAEVQVSSAQFLYVEFFYDVHVFSFVCDM